MLANSVGKQAPLLTFLGDVKVAAAFLESRSILAARFPQSGRCKRLGGWWSRKARADEVGSVVMEGSPWPRFCCPAPNTALGLEGRLEMPLRTAGVGVPAPVPLRDAGTQPQELAGAEHLRVIRRAPGPSSSSGDRKEGRATKTLFLKCFESGGLGDTLRPSPRGCKTKRLGRPRSRAQFLEKISSAPMGFLFQEL